MDDVELATDLQRIADFEAGEVAAIRMQLKELEDSIATNRQRLRAAVVFNRKRLQKDLDDFHAQHQALVARLRQRGIHYRPQPTDNNDAETETHETRNDDNGKDVHDDAVNLQKSVSSTSQALTTPNASSYSKASTAQTNASSSNLSRNAPSSSFAYTTSTPASRPAHTTHTTAPTKSTFTYTPRSQLQHLKENSVIVLDEPTAVEEAANARRRSALLYRPHEDAQKRAYQTMAWETDNSKKPKLHSPTASALAKIASSMQSKPTTALQSTQPTQAAPLVPTSDISERKINLLFFSTTLKTVRYKNACGQPFQNALMHYITSQGLDPNQWSFFSKLNGAEIFPSKSPMDYGLTMTGQDYYILVKKQPPSKSLIDGNTSQQEVKEDNESVVISIQRTYFELGSKPMKYRINKTIKFANLFTQYMNDQRLVGQTMVYLYNNGIVPPDTTPIDLGLTGRVQFDAMTLNEYRKYREEGPPTVHVKTTTSNEMLRRTLAGPIESSHMMNGRLERTGNEAQIPLQDMMTHRFDGVQSEPPVNEKEIAKLVDSFNTEIPKDQRLVTPKEMSVELKEYQRIGVTWMVNAEKGVRKGGILSDEMGLGKTVQAIACMLANPPTSEDKEERKHDRKCTLLVVPLTLLEQWMCEMENLVKKKHAIRVLPYHSAYRTLTDLKNFASSPKLFSNYDVVITTYQTLANQFNFDRDQRRQYTMGTYPFDRSSAAVGPFFKYHWHRIILDEAHIIKNRSSISSIACSYLMAEKRWCLTGTPIQNTTDDLYALFRFLNLKPYCTWATFNRDLSINPTQVKKYRFEGGSVDDRLQRLQALLRGCLLRRTKNTRIDGSETPIVSLPERIVEHRIIEFTKEEREVYDTLEKHSINRLKSFKDDIQSNLKSILVMIMRMRQLCIHKYLITKGEQNGKGTVGDDSEKYFEKVFKGMPEETKQKLKEKSENDELLSSDCLITFGRPPVQSTTTPCGHVYCLNCIKKNIDAQENEPVCPQCRARIDKKTLLPVEFLERKFSETEKEISLENDFKENGVRLTNSEGEKIVAPWISSSKIDCVMDILRKTREEHPREKTIIFCSFVAVFDLLRKPLTDERFLFVQLDGSLKTTDRHDAVREFTTNPECTLMLASLRCASVGLNLVAANRVILLDVWWNPAVEKQAIDRIHRIGQLAKKVFVTKVTVQNSIEDRILTLQEKKQELTDQALMDGGTNMGDIQRLTRNDLIFLFCGGRRR